MIVPLDDLDEAARRDAKLLLVAAAAALLLLLTCGSDGLSGLGRFLPRILCIAAYIMLGSLLLLMSVERLHCTPIDYGFH